MTELIWTLVDGTTYLTSQPIKVGKSSLLFEVMRVDGMWDLTVLSDDGYSTVTLAGRNDFETQEAAQENAILFLHRITKVLEEL